MPLTLRLVTLTHLLPSMGCMGPSEEQCWARDRPQMVGEGGAVAKGQIEDRPASYQLEKLMYIHVAIPIDIELGSSPAPGNDCRVDGEVSLQDTTIPGQKVQ
ncbi:hypothetical protein DFP73DRAFT_524764 [Morchella snyderi]|nr:hypothetical protein DFP73DRAFT_524764 [Morchella snyderi]